MYPKKNHHRTVLSNVKTKSVKKNHEFNKIKDKKKENKDKNKLFANTKKL